MAILISVISGKGSVGKSVVSTNLALALAKAGRRMWLTDLDVGGADAHIMVGELNSSVTLTDFWERRVAKLNDVAIPVTFHQNLRLIPLIAVCRDRIRTQPERMGKGIDPRLSRMADAAQGLAFQRMKSSASVSDTRVSGGRDTVSGSDAAMAVSDGAWTGA